MTTTTSNKQQTITETNDKTANGKTSSKQQTASDKLTATDKLASENGEQ
jgi:hypothetical protein